MRKYDSVERSSLRSFIDACQVYVGRKATADESSALREVLVRMLRQVPEHAADGAPPNFRVPRALGYIDEMFADSSIDLASVARVVGVTPAHLDRLLKEYTGLTFLQQLRRVRMRHADRLLLTTPASIKETASACGYSNVATFGRDFMRVHGCAPRAWRARRASAGVAPS